MEEDFNGTLITRIPRFLSHRKSIILDRRDTIFPFFPFFLMKEEKKKRKKARLNERVKRGNNIKQLTLGLALFWVTVP